MKTLKFSFIFFIFVGVSLLYANSISNASLQLNKTESHILFGEEKASFMILSEEEMKNTKGDFFGLLTALGVALIGWTMSCIDGCDKYPKDFYYENQLNF